jgi:hypothetical protein
MFIRRLIIVTSHAAAASRHNTGNGINWDRRRRTVLL